jgi:dipeptidyl aminopeptidase/acylaminoacyl peptidase
VETPVTFRVQGTQLVGIFHQPETDAARSPAVLMMHGFTATKSESHRIFVKTARALARQGVVALRFDFRGWGDSGGDSEDSSVSTMVEDAKAATDFLLAQAGVDAARLGYLGFSTGGAAAALTAGDDPRVKSVVLWNAVADGGQILQRLMTPHKVKDLTAHGRVDHNGNWIGRAFVREFMEMKPAEALAKRGAPALLIQGSNDAQVNPAQMQMYAESLRRNGAQCETWLLPGADHTFSSTHWEEPVIERTVGWFAATL